ncbi:IclR family transcriptional regulator [Auritidibacter ignavus]|uniref:IclR family transcriptional regulator n=2 Tax=Auritidibacter ignavus TaxID=678932 RepID=UPI000D725A9C|nr:IclR family transcriptional regulator [Auritidibacter ignavus]NIH72327.1 DNA-binding IclR family transcriptional regulator [Auritidibacter ignavus]WHS27656.1 IclR family transcriptional regulator [Auritidibacter ignavus]
MKTGSVLSQRKPEQYSSSRVPAAQHVLEILLMLSRQRGPVSAQLVSDQLHIPRSTVYHLLNTAIAQGFVIHYPEEKKYGLGPSAVELSHSYVRYEPVSRLASPLLAKLVDETRANGHLSTLYGRNVVYLLNERAEGRPVLVNHVGVRLLAHATASGRAMLAQLPEDQVAAMYSLKSAFATGEHGQSEGEHKLDDESLEFPVRNIDLLRITTLQKLQEELGEIRQRGYASEHSEVTEGFSSVSVAICDRNAWPVAAMTLTYIPAKTTPEQHDKLVTALRRYANILEKRLM